MNVIRIASGILAVATLAAATACTSQPTHPTPVAPRPRWSPPHHRSHPPTR